MAIWDRLVELAAEQHGYVTTRDARDIGVDPVQLRLLAARGRLERAGRGVYRVPVLPRGEHDELAAAVSWTLGRGVISHESALGLHSLSDVNPSRIHLTVPRENHPRAAGGELYRLHRRDLQATDITLVDGIPVTTVVRTIRDCLKAGTDPYQLRVAIERAEAEGTLRRAPAAELRAALDEPAAGVRARTKRASA
jgi:predicted transcriptional regulator of viral defense system